MKKFFLLGLLAAVMSLCFFAVSCDSPSSGGGLLILRDTAKAVEITISHNKIARAVWTPNPGDYYVIKLNGVIVSAGQIGSLYSDGRIIFMPSGDSPGPKDPITGILVPGGKLNIASLPYEGGYVVGISANADGAGGEDGWDLDGDGWDPMP